MTTRKNPSHPCQGGRGEEQVSIEPIVPLKYENVVGWADGDRISLRPLRRPEGWHLEMHPLDKATEWPLFLGVSWSPLYQDEPDSPIEVSEARECVLFKLLDWLEERGEIAPDLHYGSWFISARFRRREMALAVAELIAPELLRAVPFLTSPLRLDPEALP